jgi:phospholipase C
MATQPLGSQITNVIVLMLENRSFDNVFGGMGSIYDPGQNFNGLDGTEFNMGPSGPGTSGNMESQFVWSGQSDESLLVMPYPDPGELFSDMNYQIFNKNVTSGSPQMMGFASNYSKQPAEEISPGHEGPPPYSKNIMQYYSQANMPVSQALAAGYAISDTWYASGPVQTFPNRVFTLCGTPGKSDLEGAYVNDDQYIPEMAFGGLDLPTIFDVIDNNPPNNPNGGSLPNWKLYYHDFSIAKHLIKSVHDAPASNIVNYDSTDWGTGSITPTFVDDIGNNTLPTFSFIEPRYSSLTGLNPNCNHPGGGSALEIISKVHGMPINVYYGEQLLLDVYTRLYNSSIFDNTLLIVTYDEHGGLYDHVGPPAATSPFTGIVSGFPYNRYGVRVPTMFINPYIAKTSICRPLASGQVFDHTSLIKTLWSQFDLGDYNGQSYLTERDKNAQTLEGLIDLDTPRTDGGNDPLIDPSSINLPPEPPQTEVHPNSCRISAFKSLEDHLLKNVEPYKSIDMED